MKYSRNLRDKQSLQKQIYNSLGYDDIEDSPALARTRKQLRADQINDQFSQLTQKSQKKKRKIKQALTISSAVKANSEISEQMKQLEWRLEILREDRRYRQKRQNQQPITFEQMYNRQKNKYLKFRDRQKIKINDPKYLDMIGSMQMRREKRKLDSMQKIQKHIQMLDSNINNHVQNTKGYKNTKKMNN